MTLLELREQVRYITRTTTLDFTDADLDRGLNLDYSEIVNLITSISGNYFLDQNRATTDLTANAVEGSPGYNGYYCFPTNLLKVIKAEISYDGSKYTKATVYDMTQTPEADRDAGSNTSPVIRFTRTQMIVRPMPSTTIPNGIVLWYEQRQGDLVADTDEPMFEKNFHQLLVLKGALRYAMRFPEKYNELWDKKAYGLQKDLERHYKNLYQTTKVVTPNYEDFSV